MRNVILIAIAFTVLPTAAHAHALGVSYKINGAKVDIEAYYDDDSAAHKAKVSVVNEKSEEIASGVTDKDGKWSFKTPGPGKYEIRVDAGAGHRTKKAFTVAAPIVEATPQSSDSVAPQVQAVEPTREEQTRTPWTKIGIGLSAIALGSLAFVIAIRRPANRA